MDINSKIMEDNKLAKNMGKFRAVKKLIYIALFISIIAVMIFIPNKKEGIVISLFILTLIVLMKNVSNEIKDFTIFNEIYEISNTCEDTVEILEKTNDQSDLETLLGKKYTKIMDKLYIVEKCIYSSIIKERENENISNELVVEVSKSLKKPVDKIVDCVELLEKDNNLSQILELEEQSNILKYNIDELFELAKTMSGNLEFDVQKIEINNLLKQGLIEYEDRFLDKKLHLRPNIEESKVYINADGQKMWRIFEILLDNASKYSKENSRVYVNLYTENDNTIITLINTSKSELNIDTKTFIENIRKDKENNKLGLAIANNLVVLQGGSLEIVIDGDMFKVEIKFSNNKIEKA